MYMYVNSYRYRSSNQYELLSCMAMRWHISRSLHVKRRLFMHFGTLYMTCTYCSARKPGASTQ